MDASDVPVEIVRLSKTFLTNITTERFFSSVDSHVPDQILLA